MTRLTLVNLPRFLNILSQSIALMTPCCQTFESLLTSSRFASIHSPLLGFPDVLIDSVLETNSASAGGNEALSTLRIKENNSTLIGTATISRRVLNISRLHVSFIQGIIEKTANVSIENL